MRADAGVLRVDDGGLAGDAESHCGEGTKGGLSAVAAERRRIECVADICY